jgi:periplasmic protein TonB
MSRLAGRRSIGWSAVLLLHTLVLLATFNAVAPSSPHRAAGSAAPRSVMVLLRAAVSAPTLPHQDTLPLTTPPTVQRPASRTPFPQATAHMPAFDTSVAVPAEPALAPTATSVQPVPAVVAAVEPAANPLPQAASFARPDHAQCPTANYPMPLRERGIEGTVLLRVRVDAEGRAADVHLLQASGWRLFDEAALQAVRACRFIPARRDGAALASWVEFPVRFALAG